MTNYCAIIGDIVDSKKLRNRAFVQEKLSHILREINEVYTDSIVAEFTITRGDGCQGLISDFEKSYEIARKIQDLLQPTGIVFGIGIDVINTPLNNQSQLIDGPAYHKAAKMLEQAKKQKPSIGYEINNGQHELINALIGLIESCKEKRTEKQQRICALYDQLGTQTEVAKTLNINQSAVSKQLSSACYHEVDRAKNSIIHYLNGLTEN